MKKSIHFIAVMFFLLVSTAFSQDTTSGQDWLATNSWAFGFGLDYPRLVSTNLAMTGFSGFGGYVSIQRNFSEHVALRLNGNWNQLRGKYGTVLVKNNSLSGNVDLLYYLVPCESVSPYLSVGVQGVYYKVFNFPVVSKSGKTDYGINVGFGAEWSLVPDWKLNTELGYHTIANNVFDGAGGTLYGGILGGQTDSYMTFNVGAVYYFDKGEKSHYCDLYSGLSQIDYNKIEDIVKKYQTQPTEVDYNRIADIVKSNTPKAVGGEVESKWVLIGVNFDFNKASLRPESMPILSNAAEIMLTHPDVNVEIQGNTDNIGSEKYNMKLSLERADAVKDFLIAKGVAASRITTVGKGKDNPVVSNKTAEGRMLNRRIEFKVK